MREGQSVTPNDPLLEGGEEMLSWSRGYREMEFPLQDKSAAIVFNDCLIDPQLKWEADSKRSIITVWLI